MPRASCGFASRRVSAAVELGWDVLCEVGQILARGCGAQAWVSTVMGDHAQIASGLPIEAQEEIWGKTPTAAYLRQLRTGRHGA